MKIDEPWTSMNHKPINDLSLEFIIDIISQTIPSCRWPASFNWQAGANLPMLMGTWWGFDQARNRDSIIVTIVTGLVQKFDTAIYRHMFMGKSIMIHHEISTGRCERHLRGASCCVDVPLFIWAWNWLLYILYILQTVFVCFCLLQRSKNGMFMERTFLDWLN